MIVNVELRIEVADNVTEEEVAEFFCYEYGGYRCSLDNPLLCEEEKYKVIDYRIDIE